MIKVIVTNKVEIFGTLPDTAKSYLHKRLTFPNPEYELAKRQGRWTNHIPVELSFLKTTSRSLEIPRGFAAEVLKILRYNQVTYEVSEDTRLLKEVSFSFCGELYPFQQQATKAILARRFGVLNSPTGSGKTIMALFTISQRKQPTLIICHTKELLYQWRDRAMEFLNIPKEEIGIIGDGQQQIGKRLTIAIINSLYKCIKEIKNKIGFLIVDECHRVPGRTFTEAVEKFDSRYMLGLSATAYRRDRLTRVIYFYLGDRVYEINPQQLQQLNKIMRARLIVRETNFDTYINGSEEYQAMVTKLTKNEQRNQLIVEDIVQEAQGNSVGAALVLSDRKEHCQKLYELLIPYGISVELLTGSTSKKQRKNIVRDLEQGLVKILVATGSLIGEGFDCKNLNALFMTTPVKFTGRVTQYLGRILRTAEKKDDPKVFDYVDKPGILRSSFRSRYHTYERMGVILPENEVE